MAHPVRVGASALLLAVVILGAGTATSLAVSRVRSASGPLTPRLTAVTATLAESPPGAASVPLPNAGSLSLAAVFGGTATALAASNDQVVRPIASVAKTMTALVILETHPLPAGGAGPVLTISQQDVDDYIAISSSGGSYARVVLGEQLSERDLLLGLMLPSANNLALTAARWIDGTVPAFIERLNRRAAGLGMGHTHFADPDGLDAGTTSTSADLVLLAEAVVKNAALVGIVSTTSATLPDGTTVRNLDILLAGDPGWVGIKTGWTPAAGGCLLFAARRTLSPGSPPLTIVGAVLDQGDNPAIDDAHPELGGAFDVARTAVDIAYAGLSTMRVVPASLPVTGSVVGPWGAYAQVHAGGAPRYVLLRSGDRLSMAAAPTSVAVPAATGARAGSVTLSVNGTPLATLPLTTDRPLSGPSPWWKLVAA